MTGGASAALTGGNFWVGAASGLMVSVLNHAAHAVQESQKTRKSIKERFKNGMDPDAKFVYSLESVKKLIENVEGLESTFFYGKITIDDIKLTNSYSAYAHAVYEHIQHKIFIYDRPAKNWEMASTLFHEGFHAIQFKYQGGKLYKAIAKMTNSNPIENYTSGRYFLEAQAHYYQYLYGGNSFDQYKENLSKGKMLMK